MRSAQTPAHSPLHPQVPRLTRSLTPPQTLRDRHLTRHLRQLRGAGHVPAHAGGRQQQAEPRPGKRAVLPLLASSLAAPGGGCWSFTPTPREDRDPCSQELRGGLSGSELRREAWLGWAPSGQQPALSVHRRASSVLSAEAVQEQAAKECPDSEHFRRE